MPRNYWMLVTSPENFQVTRRLGVTVQGFKANLQRKVQRIEPGDRILFYISKDRCFAATATATSKYFDDHKPAWKKEGNAEFAFRVRIKPEMVLDDSEFMDASQLSPRLDYVRKWAPEDWIMAFAQTNLHLLPKKDFLLVEEEMRKIKARRPVRSGHPSRSGPPLHSQPQRPSRRPSRDRLPNRAPTAEPIQGT